jgi:hypothetical protein
MTASAWLTQGHTGRVVKCSLFNKWRRKVVFWMVAKVESCDVRIALAFVARQDS